MDDFRIKISSDLDLSKAESKINNFLNKYNGKDKIKLNVDIDSQSIARLEKQINSLKKSISSTSNVKTNIGSGLNKTTNATKKDFQILKNLANEISKKKITLAGLDTSKNENQIKTLSSQLKKLESDYKVLSKTLGSNLNASQIGELEKIFGKASDQVNLLKAKSKDLEKTFSSMSKPFSQMDAIAAGNKTLSWLKNNSNAAKDYEETLKRLAEQQKNATNHEDLRNYTKQVNAIKAEASALGKTGKSFSEEFKRAFGQIFQFAGVYGLIQNVAFEVPKQMANEVRKINAAQIELMKVSDAPTSKLNAYWDEAAESAKKYGATINEVINSTADWTRLGYGLEDAKKLSDATTLMTTIGDNMSQQTSSEGIISTLRGFKMEANEVTKIVDQINQVANTQPIDTAGIFEGLKRSASSMSAANNSLEQTISLITAANSVVQDPAKIGNGLKTISMRLRGATTELEQAGLDTEGMAESTSKLREEIMALSGVDIMLDNNTFKSTYQILEELSKKWKDLTDIQRANGLPLYTEMCA